MLVFDADPFFAGGGVFGGTGTDTGTGAGPFFAGPFGGVGISAGIGNAGIGAGAPFVNRELLRNPVGEDGADAVPRTGTGAGLV